MADFANSTRVPGRRAFLGGAAAAAVVTAVPAALAADADAALTELHRQWSAAAAVLSETMERFEALDETRELPEPPEALFRRAGDFDHFNSCSGSLYRTTNRLWYGAEHLLDFLRNAPLTRWELREDDAPHVQIPDEPARQRRDEILAAWDSWEADIARVDEESGYAAALAAKAAARDVALDLRAAIIETPATTLYGLHIKADVALGSCFCTVDEWLEELDEGLASSEQIAATVCVDLLAIMKAAA